MRRCPYCHEHISESKYSRHIAQHQMLKADGQQEEYATLPPEYQLGVDINGAPKVYCHEQCGGMTEMPEEIIRTYLQNPWFYLADRSFCTGCGKHVACRKLTWIETGENMQEYNDRLRAGRPDLRPGFIRRSIVRLLNLFG